MTHYSFPDPSANLPQLVNTHSALVNQLLHARGIDADEAKTFLAPDYDTQLHDPLLLNDMAAACERIHAAIEANERIAIFSDYDCDGIPGAVVLHDFFNAINFTNFQNYIPHRHFEGFGLSVHATQKLAADGVSLIITVDCGTTNSEAVEAANKLGVDVIITDHHEPESTLPAATAVVNPKLGNYPFADLCGAAVAFKVAQAYLASYPHELKTGWEKWWLDMVGVATVADMVPLRGENRVFAHYGLQVLRKSKRPGLQQLLKKSRVNQRFLTEEDIGFVIGPRINAASRMDTPEDAFCMLSETDVAKAADRVQHLEKLNTDRKTQVALMTRELHQRLRHIGDLPPVIVMGHDTWRPSLVGLAASSLAKEHNRPVFLWGIDGNGLYKGSCRSGGAVSVVKLMQAVTDVFSEHGGHHFSGGFTVKKDHIFTFGERLLTAAQELGGEAVIDEPVAVDMLLTLNEVNQLLINQLHQLAPFGVGNEKPLFGFVNVTPVQVEHFGKAKEHTKIIYSTESGKLEAIAFFQTPNQFTVEPKPDVPHTLLGHVEESFFMGRRQIRLRIVAITPVTESTAR